MFDLFLILMESLLGIGLASVAVLMYSKGRELKEVLASLMVSYIMLTSIFNMISGGISSLQFFLIFVVTFVFCYKKLKKFLKERKQETA